MCGAGGRTWAACLRLGLQMQGGAGRRLSCLGSNASAKSLVQLIPFSSQQRHGWVPTAIPPFSLPPQADINSSLQEQLALVTEQKGLAEARAESRATELKTLRAKVAGRSSSCEARAGPPLCSLGVVAAAHLRLKAGRQDSENRACPFPPA